MDEMTEDELALIERRCSEASPGPWRSWVEAEGGLGGCDFIQVTLDDDSEPDMYVYRDAAPRPGLVAASAADQDFIAAARQDVPRLVGEVRRLRALLDRHELRDVHDCLPTPGRDWERDEVDQAVAAWIADRGGIQIKTTDPHGDPVELSSGQARHLAAVLIRLAHLEDSWVPLRPMARDSWSHPGHKQGGVIEQARSKPTLVAEFGPRSTHGHASGADR
jgi:hypothetical protein